MRSDLEGPAMKVAERLWSDGSQKLPAEILVLSADAVGIVVDVDGVDYILTMARVPKQRPRPTEN